MAAKRPLYMETTSIAASRTVDEICALLRQNGARHIGQDCDANGKVTAVRFVLIVNGLPCPFHLPARIEALQGIFRARRIKSAGNYGAQRFEVKDREMAERVGWRQLFRWLQSQFALIETGMVKAHEVLSPYLIGDDGKTLFEALEATRFRALPAPAEKGA